MLTLKLLLLFVPTAFVAVAVWQGSDVLKRSVLVSGDVDGRSRLDVISGILLVMPILVIILLAFVIFLVIQDSYFIRSAHAFFALGLWMSAALSILVIPASVRQHAPSILAMLSTVITVLAAVYFTPVSHFVDALPPVSAVAPLIAGLGLIAVAYAALFRLRRALSSPPQSLPEALVRRDSSPDTGPQ
jgi:hypothetical protein